MSFRRVTLWQCDYCPIGAEVAGYGLPDGWFWIHRTGEELRHACSSCAVLFNDREKGRSGSNKVVANE